MILTGKKLESVQESVEIKSWMLFIFSTSLHNPLKFCNSIKGALSGLTQFLGTENPLKIMKNAFISP